jgi:hypothetical protein
VTAKHNIHALSPLIRVPTIGGGVQGAGVKLRGNIDSKQCGIHKNVTTNRWLLLLYLLKENCPKMIFVLQKPSTRYGLKAFEKNT